MSSLLNLFVAVSFLSFKQTTSIHLGAVSQLFNDFIENENTPIALSVKDCWKKNEKAVFMRTVLTSVQFMPNVSMLPVLRNDLSNKIYFIVDMNCSDSVDFLSQVCAIISFLGV